MHLPRQLLMTNKFTLAAYLKNPLWQMKVTNIGNVMEKFEMQANGKLWDMVFWKFQTEFGENRILKKNNVISQWKFVISAT